MRKRLASALRMKAPGAVRLAEIALSRAQRAAQRLAYRQRRNVLLREALEKLDPF